MCALLKYTQTAYSCISASWVKVLDRGWPDAVSGARLNFVTVLGALSLSICLLTRYLHHFSIAIRSLNLFFELIYVEYRRSYGPNLTTHNIAIVAPQHTQRRYGGHIRATETEQQRQ